VARWPLWRLPRGLRWYLCGITALAIVAEAVLARASWHAGQLELFAALALFGALAVELTRRTSLSVGFNRDVHGIWQLPVALLLAPAYALAAPVLTYALLQLRTRRTIPHRRVFSAAASGLSLAICSAAFKMLHSHLPALSLPAHPSRTIAWLAAAAVSTALVVRPP
jgi:hypothetical protein